MTAPTAKLNLDPRDIKCVEIKQPADSGWECELFGMGANGLTVRPAVGDVPNAFWRWMQYLFFGNVWRRRE